MIEYICLGVGLILCLIAIFIFRRVHLTKQKIAQAQKEVIQILSEANGALVDIRPFDIKDAILYSGVLHKVDNTVVVKTDTILPDTLLNAVVTVYFRLVVNGEDIFKWFRSTVSKIDKNIVHIDLPARVAIGQKRLFMRVTPQQEDINMITLWKMRHNQPLPDATDQVGIATVCARPDNWLCSIANISGSGIALAFPKDAEMLFLPGDFVLLFIAFRLKDSTAPVFCWLYGEVIHQRSENNQNILSLKFQNWACPKSMESPLRWFLCDEEAAVPILHWVTAIQKDAAQ